SDHVDALSLTADGRIAATGHVHGRLRLWDIQKGWQKAMERRHNWFVSACCVLPGGKIVVSGSGDATVGIWSLVDRTADVVVSASSYEDDQVRCIAPLPAGFASAGQDGLVRIWDAASRSCVAILGGDGYGCNDAFLA